MDGKQSLGIVPRSHDGIPVLRQGSAAPLMHVAQKCAASCDNDMHKQKLRARRLNPLRRDALQADRQPGSLIEMMQVPAQNGFQVARWVSLR
ncbi:MAG: hypothetical protein E5W27_04270 [Mesorhizobium sp.]|nr:MAG: hypothetical protein E5W27_04270 [Mesorhizobium sp.]